MASRERHGAGEAQVSLKSRERSARPTIGLFITDLTQPWTIPQWRGVADGARRREANLLCFPGGLLLTRYGNDAQANILYDLARGNRLDGLVIWTAGLDSYVSAAELEEFSSRYRPMPIVSVEHSVAGVPGVLMDDYGAMRDIVAHLIAVHGYRRIAFIQSAATAHPGIADRYRAYREALSEHGIPFDPSLVSPPFHFENRKNHPALNDWILWLRSGGKAAIVGFNDLAAVATLEAIRSMGLRVPEDLALTGFDDIDECGAVVPSITTVHPSFYEAGLKAAETLIDLIEGKSVAERTLLSGRLVIRRSCGCRDSSVLRASAEAKAAGGTMANSSLAAQRHLILSAMVEGGWREAAWDGFLGELNGGAEGSFLNALEETLSEAAARGDEVLAWQEAISTLRRMSIPFLEPEDLRKAEDLWQQARVAIGSAAYRQEAARGQEASKRMDILREIQADLITTFDMGGLMNALAESLPRLGIVGCFLSLYEAPRPYRYPQPAPRGSRLMLAFDARGRKALEREGLPFPSRQLAPEGIWPEGGAFSFVVEPIFFHGDQLGFVLFEVDSRERSVYETLRDLISNAIENARLFEARARAERDLKGERNLLRTLIDQIPDYIYVKDTECRFLLSNASHASIKGMRSTEDILGKTDFDFLERPLAEEYFADERRIVEEGAAVINREEHSVDEGGRTTWVLTSKVPLRDGGGEIIGLVGVSRDITERKRTEEALKLQSARLQMALDVAGTVTALLDVDEILRRVAELIREKFGYYCVSVFLVDDSGAWAVLRALGCALDLEGLVGTTRVEVGGRSMVGYATARAEARIAQDTAVDAQFRPFPALPLTRSEAVLPMLIGADTIGALDVQSDRAEDFSEDSVTILKTMACQIAVAVQNARLHAAEKEKSRELGEAYEALRENQERSLIAEKMASLGRLTAGIAHEMNTLLAALRASLVEIARLADEYQSSIGDPQVTAEDHGEIAADMKASIKLADAAAKRAASFVQGIKTQTRNMGHVEARRFDAVPVIEEALLLLGHALRDASCELSFEPKVARAELVGSPGRLAQVVTNLVANAIDASAGKGRGTIALTLTSASGLLELRVSDKGMGIPRENLAIVFEPLFTTKPFGQGTGLGLTIVHDIVVGEFGGTIDVESEIGSGSVFILRFPLPTD
jgi:PAS domain S-box-containing protein